MHMQSDSIKKFVNDIIRRCGEEATSKYLLLTKEQLKQLRDGMCPFEPHEKESTILNSKMAACLPDDDNRVDDKLGIIWKMWLSDQRWVKKQDELFVVNKLLLWLGQQNGKRLKIVNMEERPDFIILEIDSNNSIGLEVTSIMCRKLKEGLFKAVQAAIEGKDTLGQYQNTKDYNKMLLIVLVDDSLDLPNEVESIQAHQFSTNIIDGVYIIKRCLQKDYIAQLSVQKRKD